MERRQFLGLGVALSAGAILTKTLVPSVGSAAPAAKGGSTITEKDILREGKPASIANYCEKPEKQPNKYCPDWKTKPGHCKECSFFNTDASETTFKGGKYAKCQLLQTQPQYVSENAYCSTFNKKG